MGVVSKEQALIEVNEWVDFKKIAAKRRQDLQPVIENLAELVAEGDLIVESSNHTIKQVLKFPLGENGATKELIFKARVSGNELQSAMNGVQFNDELGKTFARISASTGVTANVIKKMDSEDLAVASNIAVFFTM